MEEASSSLSLNTFEQPQPQPQPQTPHQAMFLVLSYLPVNELLAMSQICTSLHDAVNNDVLLWFHVVIERPLSSKLSDEFLMKITSKAQGRLKTLSLMNCNHITDQGLQAVVQQNPFIYMLHIPGCTSITPEGVLTAVETLCQRSNCLSTLRINGIYNLQKEHLDKLAFYLKKNQRLGGEHQVPPQPVYYHERASLWALTCIESQRIIDLETCPKCFEVRIVYDCPKGDCQRRELPLNQCRACCFCIPRCENCGGCIAPEEMEEGACSDILCLNCWLHEHPKCSFCNKPYCKQHKNWWRNSSDSTFVCRVCGENSHGYTYMDAV